jgi:hypothetical protein
MTSTTTQMTYCTYDNFNPDNLTNLKPEQSKNADVPCWFINLLYNLGSPDAPDFSEFEMELCEFTSPVGITVKETDQKDGTKRIDESILIKFDTNNPEHAKCMDTLKEVHTKLSFLIGEVKGIIKKHSFKASDPITSGFKELIYFPIDEFGEPITGRAASMFLKLFSWGKGDTATSTIFVDMENKPIDKKLLTGVELKFIPLLQIRRVRSAASISVNMEIKSAIVTSVKARNTESSQLATLNRLKTQNPDLNGKVSSQLARLTANRQNRILTPSFDTPQDQAPNDTTLSGIEPTHKEEEPKQEKQIPKRKQFNIPQDK